MTQNNMNFLFHTKSDGEQCVVVISAEKPAPIEFPHCFWNDPVKGWAIAETILKQYVPDKIARALQGPFYWKYVGSEKKAHVLMEQKVIDFIASKAEDIAFITRNSRSPEPDGQGV